ncbi:MAG: sodium-dependent transporter [Candidatus Pelagadaptatus aseana]
MAAAGSAIGLGNIWGFPTQTASNGGAAFVVIYFILAFVLAYPALMAELIIGRHARANVVTSLRHISNGKKSYALASGVGFYGVITASLILSFYAIVAGWMLAYLFESITQMLGWTQASEWLTGFGLQRNLIFMGLFMAMTMAIISSGIKGGIEKWSTRLMPMLLFIMIALTVYVMTQDGAMEGLRVYLLPDFSQINPGLILDAMGQAFFSLSLGVGTMLVYGSYLSKQDSLPKLGAAVTLVDSSIAFLAGLLIIPAIFVAQKNGVTVFTESGDMIAGPDLIFQVLPSLFDSMGDMGLIVAFAFFSLMSIAAVTSSISMLEVPVSYMTEETPASRHQSTLIVGLIIAAISAIILFNFNDLFGLVIDLTTVYSQPILGVLMCVFVGWIWHRNNLLEELKAGHDNIESTLFWKIWPNYVRFVCPALILATFIRAL